MRAKQAVGVATLGLTGLALFPGNAVASEPFPTSAEHVDTPGRSIATDDTTDAVVLNPANLAWLPAPELRWTWVNCPNEAVKVGCGHAWAIGTPLPFGLSTALRVDLVQPPWGPLLTEGVPLPYRANDYVWVTWAVAAKLGDNAAFGVSLERSYSQSLDLDGLFGLSAALSWRPDTHIALAAVARDFNRPSPDLLPPQPPSTDSLPILDGRYALAVAIRPTGRRAIDIGLSAQYWEGARQWTESGTLGVDIPDVGRAFAGIQVAHLSSDERRGVVGSAGLELHFLGLGAGGGALFGDGLGGSGTAAEYVTASVAAYRQPGIPRPVRAVWLRLETTPSTRGHVALLRRLWTLARARDVEAVTLVLRAEPANSFAHAEELADAIRYLRAYGKKVLCSVEDAGPRALYACASADRIVVTPAGGVRYAGLRAEYIYLKGLLDKIGVRADFVRIGPHKTAPEQFTNEHAGPVAQEDHLDMLRQQEAVFDRNLALFRHMSEERARELARQGPFVATEARAAGLVDGLVFDDELDRATKELVGRDIAYRKYEDEKVAPNSFGSRGRVALLYLDGDIVDGRSEHIPLLDMRLVGSYSMADAIREARDDSSVRAVVLRIESPGGSSLASDVMWRELFLLAKKKPLVVSMGTVAASGGYYVASASRNIFALPLTLTGSIGVFYGKADLSGLLAKIGVTVDTYKTAPRADAESMFRGFTPEEERELTHKVEQFYDTFLDRISEGRGMSKEAIDAVGRGRVWMGQQAIQHHLVDHLGGLRDALDAARSAAGLPQDAPILELPREERSLLQRALDAVTGMPSERERAAFEALPPAVQSIARAVAPLVVYAQDEPLARMEWVDTGAWVSP
ncbi:MAG TPA: signal peptide peptidase SppA [Polyangiaceae bacterium]|nr:signal peptide peptidase SppA [Polyangiaceae bacterium]